MAQFVEIKLIPRSPLVLSQSRNNQMLSSLEYVSGSTLRGAFAALYQSVNGMDGDFQKIFSASNRFPYLFLSQSGQTAFPFPKTAYSCKRYNGFETEVDKNGRNHHGVVDLLFLEALKGTCHRGKESLSFQNYFDSSYRCSVCHEDRKPLQGYFLENRQVKLFKGQRTHVGIDRWSGTARPQILYFLEFVQLPDQSSDYCLRGVGRWEEKAFEKLKELEHYPLFLGKSRTRGYGECSWQLQIQNPPSLDAFEQTLESFSKEAAEYCKVQKERWIFSLTVQTPTILVDAFLRYTAQEKEILRWLGLEAAELLYSYSELQPVWGWNMAHGMPKEEEWAIAPSSVYLCSARRSKENLKRLHHIHHQGIGLRQEEGFGQVWISHSFHVQYAVKKEENNG
ncbi:MAG: hypothetical protein D6805_08835 [Planctomycetota bacterium]|nr:MAG: hypothetical protein D6805_08835 [Planctomycetota bacterium]